MSFQYSNNIKNTTNMAKNQKNELQNIAVAKAPCRFMEFGYTLFKPMTMIGNTKKPIR